MKLFATRHSHVELYVHMFWSTKERAAVLDEALIAALSEQARSTAQKYAAVIFAFDGISDHVHLVARYRPDLTIAKLAQALKAATSRLVRRDYRHLPDFAWQTGYSAISVSPDDVDRVIAYINNQQKHHAENTIWPEIEHTDDED